MDSVNANLAMAGRAATVYAWDEERVSSMIRVSAIQKSVGVVMFVRFPGVLVSRKTAVVMASATRHFISARATKAGLGKPAISLTAPGLRTASIVDSATLRWISQRARIAAVDTWDLHATTHAPTDYSPRWIAGTVCVSPATVASDVTACVLNMEVFSMVRVTVTKGGEGSCVTYQDVRGRMRIALAMAIVTGQSTSALATKGGPGKVARFQTVLAHRIASTEDTVTVLYLHLYVNIVSLDGWVRHVMTLAYMAHNSLWTVVFVSVNQAMRALVVTASALATVTLWEDRASAWLDGVDHFAIILVVLESAKTVRVMANVTAPHTSARVITAGREKVVTFLIAQEILTV